MTIGLDPNLIGYISWHGLFSSVAIVVGILVPALLASKAGLLRDTVYAIALWAILGGVIGARLVHVIDRWGYYSSNPGQIINISEGGVAIWGGILGGTLGALIYARIRRINIARYADIIAPGVILAQAVGRIGDIINGEHISKATNLPWSVTYSHPDSPAFGLSPSHPAVAYELLMNLIIFVGLWKLRGHIRPDGRIFLIYLTAYSIGRFFLSYLRLDSNTVVLGLNQPQWISLMVLAIVLPLLLFPRFNRGRDAERWKTA